MRRTPEARRTHRARQARHLSVPDPSPGSTTPATRSASPSTRRINPADRTARFEAPAGLDRPDRSRGLADRLAHPAAAGLRLRRAAPRDGLGPGARICRRHGHASTARTGLGLGRGRGPVLRVLGAVGRPVAPLLRRAVGRARDAGQAEAVARVPDAAHDPPAVPHRDDRAGRCSASSSPRATARSTWSRRCSRSSGRASSSSG